jgi:hypothetical protein
VNPERKALLVIALALAGMPGHAQTFHYVEAGNVACPLSPAPSTASPQSVASGVAVPGRLHVSCGFDQGSYTVTLSSTDPAAVFSPKTFLVNFGRVAGSGAFAVTFRTVGVQSVLTTITSNMGSPAVKGHFLSPANEFNIVAR